MAAQIERGFLGVTLVALVCVGACAVSFPEADLDVSNTTSTGGASASTAASSSNSTGGASTASTGASTSSAMSSSSASADGGGMSSSSSSGGDCAPACTGDKSCCSGACVDQRNDPANCGSCGKACDAQNGEICAAAKCGVVDWALWPMPNDQDDVVNGGAPTPDNYGDNGDLTVTDKVTHLMWQQQVPMIGGDANDGNFTWQQAKDYCSVTLNASTLGGHSDWRTPSEIELVSIVDYGNSSPAIQTAAFPATPSDYFWTSTPLEGSATDAWFVYFVNGGTNTTPMAGKIRVRCVR